jgi:HEAT repeat protein
MAVAEEPPNFTLTGEETLEELFVMASSSELQYEEMRQPAREKIIEMGVQAVPFLVERLGTTDARERHALEHLLENIGSDAVPTMLDMLEDEDDDHALRLGMRCLGLIGDSTATGFLARHSEHEDWKVRSSACFGLGRMKSAKATPYLVIRLHDENELVRKSAAVGLGDNEDPAALPPLVDGLYDSYYAVRYSSLYSIARFGEKAIDYLEGVLVRGGERSRESEGIAGHKNSAPEHSYEHHEYRARVVRLAVEGLGEIGAELADDGNGERAAYTAELVRPFLDSKSWSVRAAAVEALGKTTDEREWLSEILATETHPLVLGKIEQVKQKPE